MKLISWNCNLPPWSFDRKIRLPKIGEMLNALNPDIICLQEVFFESDGSFLKEYFSQSGLKHSSKYQNLLTISKFPIKVISNYKFKNQGNLFSVAVLDVLYAKAVQILEIDLPAMDSLIMANTHLLSAYSLAQPIYQRARVAQCEEIIKQLDKLSKNNFLVGDFNFVPDTEPYMYIQKLGFTDYTNDIKYTYMDDGKIDFIFGRKFRSNIKVKTTNDFSVSDHSIIELYF